MNAVPALRQAMAAMTPEQAVAHPNWSMGAKISVDSATMANKGLEMIEAAYLFDMPQDRIDVVVHPESIIHSLVEYVDGSTLAQMGPPDMRTPIAHALAWPARMAASVPPLDLIALGKLEFFAPDPVRFPALRLSREALCAGGGTGTTSIFTGCPTKTSVACSCCSLPKHAGGCNGCSQRPPTC